MTDLEPAPGSVWRSIKRLSIYPFKRTRSTVLLVTSGFYSEGLGFVEAQVVFGALDGYGAPMIGSYPLYDFFKLFEPDDKNARELYRTYRAELQQGETLNDYSNNCEPRGQCDQGGGSGAELGRAVHGSSRDFR